MKYHKLLSILLILFFNHNLFSQVFYSDIFPNDETELDIYVNFFGSDFYFGEKEISKNKFEELIRQNPSAQRDYIHGTNLRIFGNMVEVGAGVVFIGSLYRGLFTIENKKLTSGAAVGLLIGIVLDLSGRDLLRRSTIKYNQNNYSGFSLELSKNGVGLVLNF